MKSLENLRLKKAEENKRSLDQKLKEQEIKYNQIIQSLQSQLESLTTVQKNAKVVFNTFGTFKKSGSMTDVVNQTESKFINSQGSISFNEF